MQFEAKAIPGGGLPAGVELQPQNPEFDSTGARPRRRSLRPAPRRRPGPSPPGPRRRRRARRRRPPSAPPRPTRRRATGTHRRRQPAATGQRRSSLATFPSTRRTTRRARSITCGSWVENTKVTPCSRFSSSINPSSVSAVSESTFAVGSSASTTAGLLAMARAIATRAAAARPRVPRDAGLPSP